MKIATVLLPNDKFILVIYQIEDLVAWTSEYTDEVAADLRKGTGACTVLLTEEDFEVVPAQLRLTPEAERKIIQVAEKTLQPK
jgi:hypothetical protein